MQSSAPIIIVDDDMDDHFILSEIGQRLGIRNRLVFFRSGSEVLQYLKTTAQKPFIILCDINMPQMDGLELRRIIDSDDELRKKSVPFLFFSTAASAHQISEAYDLTVQGFFIKESGFEETAKTLKLILDYWSKCLHPKN
jgi:CheY-like chemotaxis protein